MADPKEVQIAAVMALAETYAQAFHRWLRAEGSYRSTVEAKARLYDGVAKLAGCLLPDEKTTGAGQPSDEADHSEADCDFLRGTTNEVCGQHCDSAGVAPTGGTDGR